jgi:hypothetical protein
VLETVRISIAKIQRRNARTVRCRSNSHFSTAVTEHPARNLRPLRVWSACGEPITFFFLDEEEEIEAGSRTPAGSLISTHDFFDPPLGLWREQRVRAASRQRSNAARGSHPSASAREGRAASFPWVSVCHDLITDLGSPRRQRGTGRGALTHPVVPRPPSLTRKRLRHAVLVVCR